MFPLLQHGGLQCVDSLFPESSNQTGCLVRPSVMVFLILSYENRVYVYRTFFIKKIFI